MSGASRRTIWILSFVLLGLNFPYIGNGEPIAVQTPNTAHVHAANFTTYVIAVVLYSILAVGAVGICGMAVQCWLRRRRNLNGPARPAAYTSSGRTVMPSRRRELYASSSAL